MVNSPKETVDMHNHRFGVEIEFTGINHDKTVEILSKHFNAEVQYEVKDAGNISELIWNAKHPTKKLICPDKRVWEVKIDESIKPSMDRDTQYQVEIATPILTKKDMKDLKTVVEKLRSAGGEVNKSCGVHIHVDAAVHTVNSLKRFVRNFTTHQDMIYHALNVCPKREAAQCSKFNIDSVKRMEVKKYKTLDEFKVLAVSRKMGMNLTNVSKDKNKLKNTVEFRLFNSTLDENVIEAYVDFCLGLSIQAINMPHEKSKTDNKPNISSLYSKKAVKSLLQIFEGPVQNRGDIDNTNNTYSKHRVVAWLRSMGLNGPSINVLTKDLKQKPASHGKDVPLGLLI